MEGEGEREERGEKKGGRSKEAKIINYLIIKQFKKSSRQILMGQVLAPFLTSIKHGINP